jgi:hypothetical protein
MLGERLPHLEAQPAGVVLVIGRDRRSLEHEGDASSGEIETGRHLGVALVRAIAETDETADPPARVEEVVVGALVEVLLAAVLVHEIVGFEQRDLDLSHGSFSF